MFWRFTSWHCNPVPNGACQVQKRVRTSAAAMVKKSPAPEVRTFSDFRYQSGQPLKSYMNQGKAALCRSIACHDAFSISSFTQNVPPGCAGGFPNNNEYGGKIL
ncbi:hypothetical protein DWY99_05870 [[Clostridium] leptum]|uniref:Uncharacterized protein n=1 Tax=[Clostridium] leptum TaxID=1535 RepID=A0A412AXW1_9FIRM|nr:hypothetical protein DWY99_05870 [[Clostridium] leptum]